MELDGVLAIAAEAVDELLTRQQAQNHLSSLESELDLKGKFLSLVSHDLRTPLTAAKISAQLIGRGPENGEQNTKLSRRIVECIDRADRLIINLLDADRLRAGMRLPIRVAPVELRALIQKTVDELGFVHQGRCRLVAGETLEGEFDPLNIRRALENLVTNAVKYGAPDSPITVTLSEELAVARIAVHNEGNPISRADQETIFQWFGRTASAQEMHGGWGLGLMLVKGIAEAHGGSVRVSSSLSAGTTFVLEIPITT